MTFNINDNFTLFYTINYLAGYYIVLTNEFSITFGFIQTLSRETDVIEQKTKNLSLKDNKIKGHYVVTFSVLISGIAWFL